MITALQLVSISDFVLSVLCLFLAGILFGKSKDLSIGKPSSKLILFLILVGLAAFMGGMDHGFFQTINQRYVPTTLTYLCIAFATYFLFDYCIQVFFRKQFQKVFNILAIIQLIGFACCSFFYHNFLLVIANYSPILILFLICNIIFVKKNSGNIYFIYRCMLFILATIIQTFGISMSELVNESTLYHIISMFAYGFFYKGVNNVLVNE